MRTAHERCRRFDSAPLGLAGAGAGARRGALRGHRAAAARVRSCHQCRLRGSAAARARAGFMDRRAFLVSYDPAADDATGTVLARVLAGIVPVVAGINLEYYFSRVDPAGYGCGTKLPHNVTALSVSWTATPAISAPVCPGRWSRSTSPCAC